MEDIQIDQTLAMVVGIVQSVPEPANVVATLTVIAGGREFTGHVITEERYFQWLADDVAPTDEFDIFSKTFRELGHAAQDRKAENARRMAERFNKPTPPPPDMPKYLHLQTSANEDGTGMWRVALRSVEAWSLSELRVEIVQ